MRTDTLMFRAKRFAALMAFAYLAGIPMAGQASSKPARPQRAAAAAPKKTDTTTSAAQPVAAEEPAPAAPSAPASPAAVTPLVPNGDPFPFLVSPAAPAEFQLQVPENPERLTVKFQVAGSGSVGAYLKFGSSPGKAGINHAEHFSPSLTGSASFEILPQSTPPVRNGTYYLRLESAAPAGGYFVATSVQATVQHQGNPSQPTHFLAAFAALPPWLVAALWVGSMACLAALFLRGIRIFRSEANELKQALESQEVVAKSLADIKKSIADLPEGLADHLHLTPPPAAPIQDEPPRHPSAARFQQLLETDPMLVIARLVREVARRAGGDTETEFGRNFASYLAALDRAERMAGEAAPASAADEEWAALHRAIGALQVRHNPVFFLDVIDEAGHLRMPQKESLLTVLGIEEITPATGLEIVDLTSYQIEHTTGMGRRSILDKVLSSGYRSRESGEVYRKPLIAVRLESGHTAAV